MTKPFLVKDCALGVLSTGEAAGSIIELKETLSHINPSSLYFHFWGRHFRPSFTHPEFHNDFARWAYTALHDPILAERLGIVDPTEFEDLETLRQATIEVVEQRLDELNSSGGPQENIDFIFSVPSSLFLTQQRVSLILLN